MKLWMDVMRDVEHILDDHERLFDAWAAGGVDGLVLGPMVFKAPDLLPGVRRGAGGPPPVATFDPNPDSYRRLGVAAPAPPGDRLTERRDRLTRVLTAAKDRGWSVWIFQPSAGAGSGGGGHVFADERTRAAICARMIDTLAHYPMVDGGIMDGPEWGYEIAPHHMGRRSFIFHDLPESVAPKCAELGYDYAALVAAKDRLFDALHALSPSRVTLHASGGLLGAYQLLGGDPDVMAWFRFRVEALTNFFRYVRQCLRDELGDSVKLGVGPRSAAFAPLCGYDFSQLATFMDVLLPKHYFWHRGFDGMVGTVYRYVETLTGWNPDLGDADALALVQALCGLALPGVQCRDDLETVLSPEFFEQVVTRETQRALAAMDDPDCVVPWVDAGPVPHDGDPMPAGQLRQLLQAAEAAGLRRFLYHHHGNMTAGEWTVISGLCGTPWRPRVSSYHPPARHVL